MPSPSLRIGWLFRLLGLVEELRWHQVHLLYHLSQRQHHHLNPQRPKEKTSVAQPPGRLPPSALHKHTHQRSITYNLTYTQGQCRSHNTSTLPLYFNRYEKLSTSIDITGCNKLVHLLFHPLNKGFHFDSLKVSKRTIYKNSDFILKVSVKVFNLIGFCHDIRD